MLKEKELNDNRSKELKELQAEKDDILKPTLDELGRGKYEIRNNRQLQE